MSLYQWECINSEANTPLLPKISFNWLDFCHSQLFNKEIRKSWDKDVVEFTSIKDTDHGEVYYTILKFPFPFKNRDFTDRLYVIKDEDGVDITISQFIEDKVLHLLL